MSKLKVIIFIFQIMYQRLVIFVFPGTTGPFSGKSALTFPRELTVPSQSSCGFSEVDAIPARLIRGH